jgi:uncharacterized repeat protein (TIGR01451 family)
MLNWQPNQGISLAQQGKRKLASAVLAAALAWLPAHPAMAVITNTVTATGTMNGSTVTDSATSNVDVQDAVPQMTVVKTGTLNDGGDGSADPNDTITYTFTLKNTGNVTLQNVTLIDTGANLTGLPIPTLAPGATDTLTFTASHSLTAVEIATGSYVNSVTGLAKAASGEDVTVTTSTTTPLAAVSSVLLEKTGVLNMGSNGRADANDTITYTFKVTNTGPTPLHNVKVSDPLVNLASLPGQDRMVAMLSEEEVPSDPITTASIDDTTPHFAAADLYANRLTVETDAPPVSSGLHVVRRLVSMTASGEPLTAGDKIGFVYAITNTGEGPLTGISVHQMGADAYGDKLDILAANQSDSANIIFTRSITAAEITTGEIRAPAGVTARSRTNYIATQLDDVIALSSISSFDNFASATITPSSIPNLAAGAFTTFTATYILKQQDIDNGFVNNTATASALNTVDQILTSVASFNQVLAPVPGVAVIKTGIVDLGADNIASLGDIVTYKFAITNTGNVTLSNVAITDGSATVIGTPFTPLAPGATNLVAFTATHPLVQADLDAGQVSNQATVSATSPSGTVVTRKSDDNSLTELDPTIVSLAPAPKIGLLKTVFKVTDVNNNGFTDKGDTITYNFSVTNTGNQTLTNIIVTDPLVDGNGTLPSTPLASLAPGQTNATYFTSVYTITQADVDAGEVDNTAKVVGTAPGNVQVQDFSDPGVLTQDGPTKQPIVQRPIITLIKSENRITDANGNPVTNPGAGDIIYYDFRVENQGNVTLTTVNIVDNLAGATVQGAPIATMAPFTFDATHFTAKYTITPADVLAGRVSNQATATARPPIGQIVSDLSDNAAPTLNNPTVTAIRQLPSVSVVKRVKSIIDGPSLGITDVGDTIVYTFDVKNTGNMPLNTVILTEGAVPVGAPIANLPAGTTITDAFTYSYPLTVADITAGFHSNQAKITGTTSNNITVTNDSDDNSFTENDPTVVYFARAPSVALLKSYLSFEDNNSNTLLDTGDKIVYRLTVINTGNETLKNITVTDNNAVVTGGPLATLAVGATDSTTFVAKHLVTNTDFLATTVTNQATVHAFADSQIAELTDLSDPLSPTGNTPTVTPLAQVPAIALIKTVQSINDANGNGTTDVNDIITYAFTVVNTGNVDLTNVVLTDTNATLSGSLALLPKATSNSTAFTATHLVTGADALAGQVSNSADVTATTPTNTTVTDKSDFASLTGSAPTITPVIIVNPVLTKTANKTEVKRGETVTYTITASNLPTATYVITDIMPPEFGFVAGSATLNGVPVAATVSGRNIDFINLTPVSGKIIIKLKLLASTTLAGGKFVNNANLIDAATGKIVAKAQATVTISIEPVFDCSDVIGRVFDDQNANGYMDEGEPGLPGVRVVTLNGVLITTDSEGRYHVPCAAVPDSKIGSNYLLKLDTRTLPTGYKLTTENPRDVRVTKGKVVKLNFGATISHEVTLDLTGKAFDKGTADLKTKWVASIDKLIDVLEKKHANLKIVYRNSGESADLAAARVAAVRETVQFAWENAQRNYDLIITSSVEAAK